LNRRDQHADLAEHVVGAKGIASGVGSLVVVGVQSCGCTSKQAALFPSNFAVLHDPVRERKQETTVGCLDLGAG
jgi:hypothetical protein